MCMQYVSAVCSVAVRVCITMCCSVWRQLCWLESGYYAAQVFADSLMQVHIVLCWSAKGTISSFTSGMHLIWLSLYIFLPCAAFSEMLSLHVEVSWSQLPCSLHYIQSSSGSGPCMSIRGLGSVCEQFMWAMLQLLVI